MDHDKTTIETWYNSNPSQKDLKEVFFYMDLTMKYLHEKGYCLNKLNLKDIEILNNDHKLIKYRTLLEMPKDSYFDEKLKREDIKNIAIFQIGIYTKCLNNLKEQFLKSHFDEITSYLPEEMEHYYRSIILKDRRVYYSDYVIAKKKLELSKTDSSYGTGLAYVKVKTNQKQQENISNPNDIIFDPNEVIKENAKNNKIIYEKIFMLKEAAFASYLIYPAILIIIGIIIYILAFMAK